MRLVEFQQQDIKTGYYDPSADKVERRKLSDTRKPVVKLSDLNRLKRMRAFQQLEKLKRQDLLAIMYAAPEDTGMGGPMGGGF